MAEQKINELPITPPSQFTDNDSFVIIDDDKSRLLPRPTLLAWVQQHVQGEKGEQGVAGRDGRDGTNGISATHSWNGTILTITSASGTSSADLKGAKGSDGTNGTNGVNGANGWNPVISSQTSGDKVVLRVLDWVGGTGTKPAIGYIGSTGIVSNIANAQDVRGLKGDQGIQGIQGDQGNEGKSAYVVAVENGFVGSETEWLASLKGAKGDTGKEVTAVNVDNNGKVKLTYNDASTVESNTPDKLTGFGRYVDGQYNDTTFFYVANDATTQLPNNKAIVAESLPTNVTTFYDETTKKLFIKNGEIYTIQVKFNIVSHTTQSFIQLVLDDGVAPIHTQDTLTRGDNLPQAVVFNTTIVGTSNTETNGLFVKVKAFDTPYDLYNISYTVAKII